MERRLQLARRLLKPSGVIFVSIGDDEQHRLRMLMDQVFGRINFVANLAVEMSTTSGPKTTNAQQGTIVKNVEYVLIFRKSAAFDDVRHTPLYDGIDKWDANYPLWLNEDGTTESVYERLDEEPQVRRDIERFELVHEKGKKKGKFIGAPAMDVLLAASEPARELILNNLHRIGRTDTPPVSARNADVPVGRWVEHRTEGRTYRVTRSSRGKVWQIYTLDRNYRTSDDYEPRFGRTVIRGDLWRGFHSDMGHVSTEGGVGFPNGKKPVRLIKQLIKWANNDPDVVVLDFFGGSGSTTHAVMEMNAADGGKRQSILVTNNEVGKADSDVLRARGHLPGSPEWESRGVFESVTRPRIETVVTGIREDGSRYSDGLPETVVFYELTYLDPEVVKVDSAYEAVAPLLWMRAGGSGPVLGEASTHGFSVTERYGVLHDVDAWQAFASALPDTATTAFIVTDSPSAFSTAADALPTTVEKVRLYERYISTFEINTGKGS